MTRSATSKGLWCLLCVLAAGGLAPAAAQYKWSDAEGRTVYGDSPPRDARNVQRLDARSASGEADALAALPFESRRAAQQFPVILYTTANCPPCDAARELLRARGIPYGERTIASKEDSDQFEKLDLGSRLPVLTVGRQAQREFETKAWHAALDAAGYPRSAQLPRNWPVAPVPLAPRPAEARPVAGTEPSAGGQKPN
jgi:glutaredoxin